MPVLALMIVAVWLLGVGTLKDLSLVLLIGILAGTYSSIFFATPLLVAMRERTQLVRNHSRRVLNRRKGANVPGEVTAAVAETTDVSAASLTSGAVAVGAGDQAARPVRPRRPSGKRER
jgi:preprotein translocase subunit SecF